MKLKCSGTAAAVGLLCCAAGCGQVTYILQQYDGPARARSEVSVLRLQAGDPAEVVAMDGDPLGGQVLDSDVQLHIEMLPGKHTLRVKNPKAVGLDTQDVAFLAEAGRAYHVELAQRNWHQLTASSSSPGAWSALVYEVQGSSGRLLREVSLPPGKSID